MKITRQIAKIFSLTILASYTGLAASTPPLNTFDPNIKMIHGSADAIRFKSTSDGTFYIQAATFKSEKNARRYQVQLKKKIRYPVNVETRGFYHIVLIGPVRTDAEVRTLGGALATRLSLQNQVIRTHAGHNNPHVAVGDKDVVLDPKKAPHHFEVIGALGVGAFDAGNTVLGVTSSETDKLVQTNNNNWNNLAAQLGVGYVHYFRDPQVNADRAQWFPSIEPEVNAYYLGNSNLKGDVWRFQSAAFNQMTYSIPIHSARVMFDAALTIVKVKKLSLYAIGGIGNVWNRAGYSDTDNAPDSDCIDQRLSLNTRTLSNFAWEAGAGLMYAINHRLGLSIEYLYADLGNMETSAYGSTGTITAPVIVPARFNLNAQAALLGLHISL